VNGERPPLLTLKLVTPGGSNEPPAPVRRTPWGGPRECREKSRGKTGAHRGKCGIRLGARILFGGLPAMKS